MPNYTFIKLGHIWNYMGTIFLILCQGCGSNFKVTGQCELYKIQMNIPQLF